MSNADFVARIGTQAGRNPNHGENPSPVAGEDWARIAASARCWAQSGDSYFPVSEVRFKAKEPSIDEVTLARWVHHTDGYSIAHLREVIIAIRCFEQPEETVFKRLDEMREQKVASDGMGGKRGSIGFEKLGGRLA